MRQLTLARSQATLFSGTRPVHSITVANKRSLWGYKGDSVSPFIKITVADVKAYPKVRGAFERGELQFRSLFEGQALLTFESNIAYTLRFMIDHHVRLSGPGSWRCRSNANSCPPQIVGMNWIELPKGTYKLRSERDKISNCQLEIDCECVNEVQFRAGCDSSLSSALSRRHQHLISHAPEGEWSHIAPLRILSFDIECAGRKGIFPEPDKDPVIQIANMVTRQGASEFKFLTPSYPLMFCFLLQARVNPSFATSSRSTHARTLSART